MPTFSIHDPKNLSELDRIVSNMGCPLIKGQSKGNAFVIEIPDTPDLPNFLEERMVFEHDSDSKNIDSLLFTHKNYDAISRPSYDLIKLVKNLGPISFKTPESCYNAKKCIFFVRSNERSVLFREYLLPRFFIEHPHGKIVVLKCNFNYELLAIFLRVMFYLANFGIHDLKKTERGLAGLRQWQSFNCCNFSEGVLHIPLLLFYPEIKGIIAGTFGIHIAFIFSETPEEEKRFPTGWADLFSGYGDFTEQDKSLADLATKPGLLWRRYIPGKKISPQDTKTVFDWYVSTINSFLKWLLGFKAYCRGSLLDLQIAMETLLSVDRLARLVQLSITSQNSFVNRTVLFQSADLLEGITRRLKGNNNLSLFKELFRTQRAESHFSRVFANNPTVITDVFGGYVHNIYRELNREVLNSAFVNRKHQKDCRRSKHFTCKCDEEFVIDILRGLRNTHHGYAPSETKKGKQVNENLWISTGNLPDSANSLPLLWFTALLSDPANILNFAVTPR